MILCVNLNPARDKTLVVEDFRLGAIHRPSEVLILPGGKGCNVARVLHTLGARSLVTGWLGGHNGAFITQALTVEGIQARFINIAHETRACTTVLDPTDGRLTEVYEIGQAINPADVDSFLDLYKELLPTCQAVILSGSLPPGAPANFYAQLIALAHQVRIPCMLDSSGEPLRLGVAAQPTIVKPNRTELAELVGQASMRLADIAHQTRFLADSYQTISIVSLGDMGALACQDGQLWRMRPPKLDVVSAVGSGDALMAGVAYARSQGADLSAALRLGGAAGAANALALGAGRLHKADIDSLLHRITVEPFSP